MNRGVKLLFSTHRISGTLIALFFLMWFVTGLVLLYHPFPRVSAEALNAHLEQLPDELPSLDSIRQRAGGEIRKLHIYQYQGQTLLEVSTADTSLLLSADPSETVRPITFASVEQTAQRWFEAPIVRVDTLHQRAQWVLFTKYDRMLPIYRFYFDDPEQHELFISGQNGQVQQLTTRSSRLWAWVGAIPHKLYIPALRCRLELWMNTFAVGGALCFLAALSGLFVSLYVLYKQYRRHHTWKSPYHKRWYHLHHVWGLVFSIVVIAWGISGYFSMQRIPQWLINTQGEYIFNASRLWGKKPLPMDAYRLDYRTLKQRYPDLKEVTWGHFREIPAYEVIAGNRTFWIDASTTEGKELWIPEETVAAGIRAVHGEEVRFQLETMEQYDNYYLSRSMDLPLPVYRITVEDANRSRYYVSPQTGYVRYLNKNKVVKKWLFQGIHYLHTAWFMEHPVVWQICLWICCLGGAFVCLTGSWLGFLYVKRIFKHHD